MERDTNQMSSSAPLCRSGCGFYGSPAQDSLCSKCYKDALKRKQSAPSSTSSQSANVSMAVSGLAHSNVATTGRNSPALTLAGVNVDSLASSNTLPLLSTIECLNASPNVPSSAILTASAQESKLEGASNQENTSANISTESVLAPQASSSSESQQIEPPKTQKKKRTKCTKCKTNVGVIGFPCRCGGIFCSLHRYSNEHSCSFDYREHGAEEIRKNNPQIIGEKIQKI